MRFVLKRKKHFSESGFLSELVSLKYKDSPFKIHSYFVKIKAGFVRAKHYHKKKKEWMTGVCGKTLLRLQNVKTKAKKEFILDANAKEQKIVYVPPYWAHSIRALGKDSAIVVFVPEPGEKSDDFSYEI